MQEFYDKRYEEIKKFHTENPDKKIIIIHNGVYDGSQKFQIEKYGYNNASFPIPDVRNKIC